MVLLKHLDPDIAAAGFGGGHAGGTATGERVKDYSPRTSERFDQWSKALYRLFRRMVSVARVFPGDHVRDGTVRGLRPPLRQQVGALMGVTHER